MHPQLSDRNIVCRDFIQALEACHADSWAKFTGGCNQAKFDLNMCLRKERLDKAAKNRGDAKVRREKTELAWKEINQAD